MGSEPWQVRQQVCESDIAIERSCNDVRPSLEAEDAARPASGPCTSSACAPYLCRDNNRFGHPFLLGQAITAEITSVLRGSEMAPSRPRRPFVLPQTRLILRQSGDASPRAPLAAEVRSAQPLGLFTNPIINHCSLIPIDRTLFHQGNVVRFVPNCQSTWWHSQ